MILLAAVLLVQAGGHTREVGTYRVESAGKQFRVTIRKNNTVTVARKAIVTNETTTARAEMRDAFRQLTGCEIADAFWKTARLYGIMDCRPDAPKLP